MTGEFDLIERIKSAQRVSRAEVSLGIGDDAALLRPPAGHELVISTDTLNSGVHFPDGTPPADIGYKAMAVNLSDLAAMGAEPLAVNLSLSLPEGDNEWMDGFIQGFLELATQYQVQITGGDTVQGPLSISVTAIGLVPQGRALTRSGARPGDLIYVSGTLGDAGAALLALQGELKLPVSDREALLQRLNRPTPRLALGQALRGIASSCIDVSDGLTADLTHVLEASGVGARVMVEQLPVSSTLQGCFDLAGGWALPLGAGDDYELCFNVPQHKQAEVEMLSEGLSLPLTWIGHIEAGHGLHLLHVDGSEETVQHKGYEHFSI